MDRCRGLLAGLSHSVRAFSAIPAASTASRSARARAASATGAGTGNFLSQLPAGLGGLRTSAAGLCFGGLPAVTRGLSRFQRREHLLPGLGSTRLHGDRARLGAAPGRFGLSQLRGHHFRVQRRYLPARQRNQRLCLPDQRLQRAERVSSRPRRHRAPVAARRPRSVMETTRARITAEHPDPATPGHRNQVPAARPLAATLARLPAQHRAPEGSSTDSAATPVPSVMEIPFLSHRLFSSPGNERKRGTASTPVMMQQAARASGILRPGRAAGSRPP